MGQRIKNRGFYRTVILVIAAAFLFVFILNQSWQSNRNILNTKSNDAENLSKEENNNSLVQKQANDAEEGSKVRDNQTNQNNEIRNLTKISLKNEEEKKVAQLISEFETNFFKKDFNSLFSLFSEKIRDKGLERKMSANPPLAPIDYEIISIDFKADGTAIVAVLEKIGNDQPEQKLFDLGPENGEYKLFNYFTARDSSLFSGF